MKIFSLIILGFSLNISAMQSSNDDTVVHNWQLAKKRSPDEWQNLVSGYLVSDGSGYPNKQNNKERTCTMLVCANGKVDLNDNHVRQFYLSKLLTEDFGESREDIDLRVHGIAVEDIQNLFNYNKRTAKKLNNDKIEKLFFAADVLEHKDVDKIGELALKRNVINDKTILGKNWVEKRKKIINADAQRKANEINIRLKYHSYSTVSCDFSNLGLTDNDIKMMAYKNTQSVQVLDLSQNQLTKLNLKHILKVFPNLATLIVSHNLIKKITRSDWKELTWRKKKSNYPERLSIDLTHNQLTNIEYYSLKTPQNCTLEIGYNNLTPQMIHKMNKMLQPSFFEANQDNLHAFVGWATFIAASFWMFPKAYEFCKYETDNASLNPAQLGILNKLTEQERIEIMQLRIPNEITSVIIENSVAKITYLEDKYARLFCAGLCCVFLNGILAFVPQLFLPRFHQFRDNEAKGTSLQYPLFALHHSYSIREKWKRLHDEQKLKGLQDFKSLRFPANQKLT